MGAFYETIPDNLIRWALTQPMFYVATAPLETEGHINISPKGGPYFGIVSPTLFWYLDLSGSGVETLAHLHEPGNGRITVMFVAFDGSPRIVRFWGKGEVLEYGTQKYLDFVKENNVNAIDGTRSIVLVKIHQVGSSCGYSVPKFDFKEHRKTLNEVMEKKVANDVAGKGEDGLERYWAFKNSYSVDGIPAMKRGLANKEIFSVTPIKKFVGPVGETSVQPQIRFRSLQVPAWSLVTAIVISLLVGGLATLQLQVELRARNLI